MDLSKLSLNELDDLQKKAPDVIKKKAEVAYFKRALKNAIIKLTPNNHTTYHEATKIYHQIITELSDEKRQKKMKSCKHNNTRDEDYHVDKDSYIRTKLCKDCGKVLKKGKVEYFNVDPDIRYGKFAFE